ncbi:site-specific integrase [Solwaraspora sp. WMMA2080]|uniref:tyrosine-type recombinase/integrase n=1 Tax=unclassified Solwaraspora TaxID=2627926 RepID=UPI00248C7396|nr:MULTISPECIES: site-specific integrase [unclassified Solwaraspora]WBB95281.1 site-specific integrase [Solwaraspora sp. WMMA2059]WBC20814.1 site-specific integrase [Solwaraspora sp. WMMA2080]
MGRKPNGASSIYKGTDGYWHGRVTVGVKDNGRPDRRHVSAKTEAEVTRKVRALERERDNGTVRKTGQRWTVEKWLTHWVETIAAPSVRETTMVGYRAAVYKHLIPGIGAHRLNRLEPEHLEKLYAKMIRTGSAPGTAHQAHRTVKTALNVALRRGHVARNVAQLAKAPRLDEQEIEPFTVKEAQRILTAAANRRNGVRFALALALGLRKGEALGLKWRRIDLDRGLLRTPRQLQRHKWQHGCDDPHACGQLRHKVDPCPPDCRRHKQPCPPPCPAGCTRHASSCPKRHGGGLKEVDVKSRAGRRAVGIPRPLLDALRQHKAMQEKEREVAAQLWQEGGWVFAQPNGRPIDPRADHESWKALLREANVRDARLHDARHTAATILLVLGVPTRAVMEVMGWSQMAMTTRYQHLAPGVVSGIADQVAGLLWEPTETTDD